MISDKQKQNPAAQSLNRFGSMIKSNVINPIAKGMNYANPVTFTKNVWDAAGRLPQTMANADAAYGKNVINDLQQKRGTMMGTPMNPTKNVPSDYPFPGKPLPNNQISQGAEVVQGVEANYVSPTRPTQQAMPNVPTMQQPQKMNIQTGGGTQQVMPNQVVPAQQGNQQAVAMFNASPQQAQRPDFSTGDINFDKRHGNKQRAQESAAMNAQSHAANAQTNANRVKSTANIAAGNQAVDREKIKSNEGIAAQNAAASASQSEFDRKKYEQGRVDKANEFDADIVKVMGQHVNNPDFWTMKKRVDNASPEEKQGYEDAFQQHFKFPSSMYNDLFAKKTQPRQSDDMNMSILPPA